MNIQKMSSVSVHPIRASFFQIDFSANLRNHFTCLYNLISRLNEVHASAAQKKKKSQEFLNLNKQRPSLVLNGSARRKERSRSGLTFRLIWSATRWIENPAVALSALMLSYIFWWWRCFLYKDGAFKVKR